MELLQRETKNHTNIPQLNSITRNLENKASSNISTIHTVTAMINSITAPCNNYATVLYTNTSSPHRLLVSLLVHEDHWLSVYRLSRLHQLSQSSK